VSSLPRLLLPTAAISSDIRRSLTIDARHTAVAAFVPTRVDYCNAVFHGAVAHTDGPEHRRSSGRQCVKFDHITAVVRDVVHWLPVPVPHGYSIQGGIRCFWLCARHRSGLFQWRLHSSWWDRWSVYYSQSRVCCFLLYVTTRDRR